MLISVSGPQRIGKSTFIEDFLKAWPMFKTPETISYRELTKEKGLPINKQMTKEGQFMILESMIDQLERCSRKNDNIIFDRSPLDNLAYTIWGFANGIGGIDDAFVNKCRVMVRKSIQKLDLMLLIPISKQNIVPMVKSEQSDTDLQYQDDINKIFQAFKQLREEGDNEYFVDDDCSPILEIYGNREERINMLRTCYLKEDGTFYGEDESLIYDATGNKIGSDEENFGFIDTGESHNLKKQLGIQ